MGAHKSYSDTHATKQILQIKILEEIQIQILQIQIHKEIQIQNVSQRCNFKMAAHKSYSDTHATKQILQIHICRNRKYISIEIENKYDTTDSHDLAGMLKLRKFWVIAGK